MKKTLSLPWPAYACDWCPSYSDNDPFALIALASFLPTKHNELVLVGYFEEDGNLKPVTPATSYKMAATKAQFCPRLQDSGDMILALAGSDVTLYRIKCGSFRIEQMAILASSKALKRNSIASEGVNIPEFDGNGSSSASTAINNSAAPITSISWSPIDPSLLLTASYDTTCTIWNINSLGIKTQLIAHDKEVFDVAFSPVRPDSFVSVGAEGSLRLFDTRYYFAYPF